MRALLQKTSTLLHTFQDGATCVLPISVGWDYHEGECFKSSIELVCRRFSFCRIVVCDTLQRHSLRFTDCSLENSEMLLSFALNKGDAWLRRNEKVIANLTIPYTVERWDTYLLSRRYATSRKRLDIFFSNNQYFADIFYRCAENIYEKFIQSNRLVEKSSNYKKDFISSSVEYLLEECAVVLGWEENKEDILLYPKSIGGALEETMNIFFGKNRLFLQPLQIRFKK